MPQVVAPDGVHIHYRVEGTGAPVVLLHGISADAEMNWEWTGIAPALRRRGLMTVGIDQRGHGRSDKPRDPDSYHDARFVSDVSAVLDRLRVEKCLLCGYSMGAYMALRAAAVEPRVDALVLGGIGDTAPKAWDREEVARALEIDELPASVGGEARAIREYADATGADRHALAAIQRGRTTDRFALDDLTLPTLVVVGEDDELAGDAERLARTLPNATYRSFPGDHASVLLEPGFVATIVDFACEHT